VNDLDWWAGRIRQASRHLHARVTAEERDELLGWLTIAQLGLFATMHRADQRHGLDVVARLRAEGHTDPDLLLAALFHDCAKGPGIGLAHRTAWSLSRRYGDWVLAMSGRLPGFRHAFEVLRHHAEASAALAEEAGCSPRTVELIRHQDRPIDPVAGAALRLADEAS
jgi:hypothetical protein